MKINSLMAMILSLIIAVASVSCGDDDSTVETTISLDKRELTIKVGKTNKLVATVTPENTVVEWISSDNLIASVDDEGLVTGIGTGTVTIMAKAGDKTATCTVIVAEIVVTLDKQELTLIVEDTETLIATIDPDDLIVAWSSSNNEVATVDDSGVVTAVSAGTATISVEAGGKSASCEVTVKEVEIELSTVLLNLFIDQTVQLEATVTPSNLNISWESSNLSVATVDDEGNVTAIDEGTAIIRAKVGQVTAECTVTVDAIPFDIYVVGYENTESYDVATVWKNDEMLVRLTDGTVAASADALFVSGDDVYVTGKEGKVAKFWKVRNGQIVENVNLTDGVNTSYATGVCVSQGDVYVSGYEVTSPSTPKLWKNGTLQSVDGTTGAYLCIAAHNNDIYTGGYAGTKAVIWKNGQLTHTLYEGTTGVDCRVNKLYISGGHIYAAGNVGSSARSWTDGTMQTLDGSIARGVCAIGEDVYVVGQRLIRSTPIATYGGAIWKNGTIEAFYDQSTGMMGSVARGIFPWGKNVFVAGQEYDGPSPTVKIWKNEVMWQALTDGTKSAGGNAIFIVATERHL